uniref:SHSP domain-containing protein n=2 Tax=Globodera TaxID=31242 RepID=A0A914HET6_GLORO
MRERFEKEMRRVDEEMQRLRQEFEGYRPAASRSSPFPPTGTQQPIYGGGSSLSNGAGGTMAQHSHNQPAYDPYLENLKSPLIRDESDGKTLRLRFDVSQYRPEEVTVKTVDNRLLVHAKHEEKTPSRTVYREYNQEFMLPRGTNPEQISSTLSTDGVLTVEAPLPQLAIQQH